MRARPRRSRSYVGCEFYAADLDNVALDDMNNASAQQFAVAVTNPHAVPIEVKVEINEAAFGETPKPRTIDSVTVPPGALEVFKLPRREVDGSSEHGLNDGTHTAVTSNAFRVSSSHPIIAYQFNPLENVHVFSNDASLLLPTSAIGPKYTVVSWPETIGDSDDPQHDFDHDLERRGPARVPDHHRHAGRHAGARRARRQGHATSSAPGRSRESGPGDTIDIQIGPYDVVNLETAGLNADFTGTLVTADKPVTVFVGSEASDVPLFGDYATRQCCADHLEEQLIPDSTLGSLLHHRAHAVAHARAGRGRVSGRSARHRDHQRAGVGARDRGRTRARRTFTTTLPPPNDKFELRQGEDTILRADQDFMLEADQPVSVLQAMGSQGVTGIPHEYPGGDPSLIVVPPIEQYRRDYIFLTPDKYAFDFVTIMADADTQILLDGEPLPDTCTTSPADGIERAPGDEPRRRA